VTKSEGGSSVQISTGEDEPAKLEIYLSANRHMRNCALITDVPEQLVAALELEPANLPHLHSLLQVPLASLKALLVRKGITSGDAAYHFREILVADSVNEDVQSQNDSGFDGHGVDSSTASAGSIRSDSVRSVTVESTHASARSEAANTTLRPHLDHGTRSRSITPENWPENHLHDPSDESPSERPVAPPPMGAGLYSIANRSRNRERLQAFARNEGSASSSRPGRSGHRYGHGGAFDMSTLSETLEAAAPAPVSPPALVDPSLRRRARPRLNRTNEEIARDFEVGFLGEHFVSP
jgi:hypothetical protein